MPTRAQQALFVLVLLGMLLLWCYAARRADVPPLTAKLQPIIKSEASIIRYEFEAGLLADTAYLPGVLDAIDHARHDIRVLMFVADPLHRREGAWLIAEALKRAAARGVRVRVLFEEPASGAGEIHEKNKSWLDQLAPCGVDARFVNAEYRTHNKDVLVDDNLFFCGNHNWTNPALLENSELSLRLISKPEAFAQWRTEFDAAFDRSDTWASFKSLAVRNVVPQREAGSDTFTPNARGALLVRESYIAGLNFLAQRAETEVWVGMYYIAPRTLEQGDLKVFWRQLLDKIHHGMAMRVVLDQLDRDGEASNQPAMDFFRAESIPCVYDSPDRINHLKAVVVDRRYLVVGSHNWSILSTGYNSECSVILDAPRLAQEAADYLERVAGREDSRTGEATQGCAKQVRLEWETDENGQVRCRAVSP